MSNIFQFLQKKLVNVSKQCDIRNAIVQNTCIDMVNVHDVVDESRHPSWARFLDVFNITQKLTKEHSEEILNVECLEYSSPPRTRSISVNDQAIKWAKAKGCVYTDSVLCVGQVKDIPGAVQRWKGQVEDLRMYWSYRDAVGIDGEAIEFEWKIVPGFASLSFLREIQQDLEKKNNPARRLQGPESSSCQCSMTLSGKMNDEDCVSSAEKSRITR